MAEGYFTDHSLDQTPDLSINMESLAIRDKTERDAHALSLNLASLPSEIILHMVEGLLSAHDIVQTGYAGSDALRSAQAGISAVNALCAVSRQMDAVARPSLYRTIVVSDPYKLHRLRATLDKYPELGEKIKSLTMYRNIDFSDTEDQRLLDDGIQVPQTMTLSQFSETLAAVLEETPNLVTLSLNFDNTTKFPDANPFAVLKTCLRREISRARNANNPQAFLPNVATLGILLPPGGPSAITRSEEYRIFNGLLNLPALSHIVVRRSGPGPFEGNESYRELLSQRKEALRDTITSIDLKVGGRMPWDDVGPITAMFPALSSLVLSHRSHQKPVMEFPLGWPEGRIHRESLRHLSIDIVSPKAWFSCPWFSDSINFQFHFAPMLQTLKIPMRLLRDPSNANGAMLNPRDVLPGTLHRLTLISDLRVFRSWDADGEDVAPVEEDYQDQQIPMPYPIARHMTIPSTIRFLEDIGGLSPTYFSQLNMLSLEYQTDLINDRGFAVVNQILNSSERYFVLKLQDLQRIMGEKDIRFTFTQVS